MHFFSSNEDYLKVILGYLCKYLSYEMKSYDPMLTVFGMQQP